MLSDGLTLTEQLAINLDTVEPNFAQVGKSTAATITRSIDGAVFTPTPRVFLMPDVPQAGDFAAQLSGVKLLDDSTLSAVIPAGVTAGQYDLVVVNPTDSRVGLIAMAATITAAAPAVIDNVVPQSLVAAAGQILEIRGRSFSSSNARLACVNDSCAATANPNATAGTPSCVNNT